MVEAPLVSVVIPCYNHGRFLGDALASVGTPDVRTEIIVIDDGSTDSTPEVVATFETSNDFRSVRQGNAGLAAARNRGLRESHGRYVIFLDADDRLAPGAVDIGAGQLDEHPECAFTFGRCKMMDESGTLTITSEQPRIVRDHYRELLRRNYIWMPAMVAFRREALERIGGFNKDVDASADYEMYLRIARHHPVHDHAQVVAHYRKHAANMSGSAGRMLRETLAVMRSQRPFLEGDEASLAAYEEGWRKWQTYYGDELAAEIGSAAHEFRWAEAAVKAMILGRYHPRGLWRHAVRKTQSALRAASMSAGASVPVDGGYAGRAIPVGESSAPTTRPSSSPGKR
ncbi:MAG: glycosyltransferase [Acidobacteria bacterium]|nr:glycosyltransferase [Acidobacteriota bacterium]